MRADDHRRFAADVGQQRIVIERSTPLAESEADLRRPDLHARSADISAALRGDSPADAPCLADPQAALSDRVMADGFDPVAVGIAQERRIIVGMIVAQAGRAIVGAAIGDAGVPENIDLGPRFRLEAPVATKGSSGFAPLRIAMWVRSG